MLLSSLILPLLQGADPTNPLTWIQVVTSGGAVSVLGWQVWAFMNRKITPQENVTEAKTDSAKLLDAERLGRKEDNDRWAARVVEYREDLRQAREATTTLLNAMQADYEKRIARTDELAEAKLKLVTEQMGLRIQSAEKLNDDLLADIDTLNETLGLSVKVASLSKTKREDQ